MDGTPTEDLENRLFKTFASRIDHADPGAHNNLGVFYLRKNLVAEAMSQFELALELDPKMRVAEDNLLAVARDSGVYDQRITQLREGLRNRPGNVGLRRSLALAYYRSGQYEGAARELEIFLSQLSDDLPALMLLARAQTRCGKPGEAALSLRVASRLDPDSGVVQLELAQALYNHGMWEGAKRLLRRSLSRNPDNPEAHTLMAFVMGDLGFLEQAEIHSRRALQLNPLLSRHEPNLSAGAISPWSAHDAPTPRPAERLSSYFELAMTYAQKGYYTEALDRFGRKVGEDEKTAVRGLAETLILAGDFEQAIKHLGELTRKFAADSELLNELGACLYQLGEISEARRAFREALRYDSAAPTILNNLAITLLHGGEVGGAKALLQNASERDPRAEVPALNLAMLFTRTGEVENAFELYRGVLARNQKSVEAWIGIGLLLVRIERFVDARNAFLRAVETEPGSAQAHYNLSFALSSLGEYSDALRAVSQAQAISPYYSSSEYRLVLELSLGGMELSLEPVVVTARGLGGAAVFEVDQKTVDSIFEQLEQSGSQDAAEADPLQLARDYYDKGLFEQAHAEVNRAIARGANNAEAHALAAELLTARGLYGEALERYQDALERSPHDNEIRVGEIKSLVAMKDFDIALVKAKELISGGYRTTEIFLLLAQGYAGINNFKAGYRALEQARERSHNQLEVERLEGKIAVGARDWIRAGIALQTIVRIDESDADAWYTLGEVEEAQDNLARAEGCYKRVLEISRGHGGAAISLSSLYRGRGEFNSAVNVLVDLLIFQPSDMEALLALGQSLLDAGRDEPALQAFRSVLARDVRNVAGRYLAGFAYARLRNYSAAIAEWEKLSELDEHSELSEEARKHIAKARGLIDPSEVGVQHGN